jgi:uncharacterized membrane protein YdcZ (DUF606 family)
MTCIIPALRGRNGGAPVIYATIFMVGTLVFAAFGLITNAQEQASRQKRTLNLVAGILVGLLALFLLASAVVKQLGL